MQSAKKKISSKVILVILLLCAAVITLGFVASMLCYAYRRDKYSIQRSLFSSDKDTSCNSATNLILSQATSIGEHGGYTGSSNCITGSLYIYMTLFLLLVFKGLALSILKSDFTM